MEGLNSQVLRGQTQTGMLKVFWLGIYFEDQPSSIKLPDPSHVQNSFKIHRFLLQTNETDVQTSFASFAVTLLSYPTDSDTHKAPVDRAKSPDAFSHHQTRVLHHL